MEEEEVEYQVLTVEEINNVIYAAQSGQSPEAYGIPETSKVMELYNSLIETLKQPGEMMPIRD